MTVTYDSPMAQRVPAVARELRRRTRRAHQRLDHHPLLQRLVRPGLTRESYAAVLRALHRPHAELEAAVAAASARLGLAVGEAAPAPPRLPQLEADLQALGEAWPSLGHPNVPIADSLAALVGQRYVLDGSRLGGQVIARQVIERLGADAPRHFFADPDPEWHWQRFLVFAERHCPPDEIDCAVAAAQVAFADFLAHLDGA